MKGKKGAGAHEVRSELLIPISGREVNLSTCDRANTSSRRSSRQHRFHLLLAPISPLGGL